MFERGATLTAEAVAAFRELLGRPERGLSDAGRIDQIRVLEELKSAAAAAQAVLSVDFAASQRAQQQAGHEAAGRGIASQVALARRESPHRGSRLLGLAQALVGGELRRRWPPCRPGGPVSGGPP